MADRPQDQPKPTGIGGSHPPLTSEVGVRDVIAYLRQHPDFLDQHPEALQLVRAPARKTDDGVLDFQHFMLERLRRDVVRLEDERNSLISTSRGNLASQCRVHKAVVAMLRAANFEHLLQIVTTDLAVLIDVDVVTLGIENEVIGVTEVQRAPTALARSARRIDHVAIAVRDLETAIATFRTSSQLACGVGSRSTRSSSGRSTSR